MSQGILARIVPLILAVWPLSSCKTPRTGASAPEGTSEQADWVGLDVGKQVRMSPVNQASQCYLPGATLSLANCGDQAYWKVRATIGAQARTFQSTVSGDCMRIDGNGQLGTTPCRSQPELAYCTATGAHGAPAQSCQDAKRQYEQDLADYQSQVLTYVDSRLQPAFTERCVKQAPHQGGVICTKGIGYGSTTVASDPVNFFVGGPMDEPSGSLLFKSGLRSGGADLGTTTFAPEIRWGHVPRITAIYVATESNLRGMYGDGEARPEAWITGIQLHYAGGEKFLIGTCNKNRAGDCLVDRSGHPDHPNPMVLAADEYLTAVGMKFGAYGDHRGTRDLPHGKESRLVELMLKTNKFPAKSALWKGTGSADVSWQWLTASKSEMIAGFYGRETLLSDENMANLIQAMGVFIVDIDAYKAHNPDVFFGTAKTKVNAISIKDAAHMIGMTDANRDSDSRGGDKPEGYFDTGVNAAYRRAFTLPDYRFSSTFYGDSMGHANKAAVIRAYFDVDQLTAVVVYPSSPGGNLQAEVYGTIPPQQSPNILLVLAPGEYLTQVNWRSAGPNPNRQKQVTVMSGYTTTWIKIPEALRGPRIVGLQLVTSRGRVAEYATNTSQPWSFGFGAKGYAIVGFHGISIGSALKDELNFNGILNMGGWLVLQSALPKGS